MKFKIQSSKLKTILLLSTLYFLLSTSLGCEAFRKKFVRKPKKQREIEVVVHAQEYEPEYSAEETYKRYFLFWRAAHEELINALNTQDGNRKKLLSSAKKIVENLEQMQQFLLPEKQTRLGDYILEQKGIVKQLDRFNLSYSQKLQIKSILEKQKRKIQKEFAYKYVQEYLIKE